MDSSSFANNPFSSFRVRLLTYKRFQKDQD